VFEKLTTKNCYFRFTQGLQTLLHSIDENIDYIKKLKEEINDNITN